MTKNKKLIRTLDNLYVNLLILKGISHEQWVKILEEEKERNEQRKQMH